MQIWTPLECLERIHEASSSILASGVVVLHISLQDVIQNHIDLESKNVPLASPLRLLNKGLNIL